MRIMKTATVAMLCSSAFVAPVYAQEAQEAQESQDSADNDDRNVIIVTATRRAEDIQEIPLAVTAISPEQLDRQGVLNVRDIAAVATSFSSSTAQIASGSVVLRIRGVGTTSNNIGFESAVGIFIDGVYQSRPGVALSEFVDVERVEVLRGPQGTLFGRNTSAGALNITNVRPDLSEFGGFANATYGNFNTVSVQGAINAPIVKDTLALRLTGAYREADGNIDVLGPGGDPLGETNSVDQYLVRGQLGFENDSGLSVRLIADYSKSTSSCCGAIEVLRAPAELNGSFGAVGLGPRGGQFAPIVPSDPFDQTQVNQASDNRVASANRLPVADIDQWGISGEIKFPLGANADVIYIGSYRDFQGNENYDTDFTALDIFDIDNLDTEIITQTHEVRVQGEALGGRVSWLVGGFYSNEDIRAANSSSLGTDFDGLAGALFGGAVGPTPLALFTGGANAANNAVTNVFTQDSESFSIFTNNTIELTQGLDFSFGLRYSDETKEGSFSQPLANNETCAPIISNLGGVTPAGAAPIPGESPATAALRAGLFGLGCFAFTAPADLAAAAVLPLPLTFNGVGDDAFTDDELIWTVKLAYEFAAPINVYASFTHGFKSGGFNLDATAAFGGADPRFASEEVDAFEVGVKAKFLNDALTVNVAGFYEEFTDFQVLEFTGARFETFNVPRALSRGVEIESVIIPSDSLSFNVGLTYVDADYPDDCAGTQTAINVVALCGNSLTNAPELVAIIGGTFTQDIGDNLNFFLNGQIRAESDSRTSTQAIVLPTAADIANAGSLAAAIDVAPPLPFDNQNSNVKINLRAGIGGQDKEWSLEAFVNNLTNANVRGVTFNTTARGGSRSAFLLEPRTYGLTLRGSF